MTNFCTNCGTKLNNDYKFCTNCGTEITKDYNYCTNCGTKLNNDYKFCTNCGTEITKSNIKKSNTTFKTVQDHIKKEKEEKKILKMIDDLFESEEIKSEIGKNNIDPAYVIFIKDCLKEKLIEKKENMIESEIKYFIKTELKKASRQQRKSRLNREKKMRNKKIEENKRVNGGYCSLNCRHCYEEFFDSGGGIVGDFDSEGYTEYYCHLGHSISFGRFCKDYE